MPDSFGARLRTRREERHMSLATIADRTKIKNVFIDGRQVDLEALGDGAARGRGRGAGPGAR